ncbi:MAG: sulfotransferase [Chitinophagales bacterium]|nr:sulfotransferase [Chitinophagales bacterium]MDW8428171.1 sulfotransferase [Chitinophagales bacterium]
MNKAPTFFVVGAPKSGTTSLYYYLRSHPQLYVPRRKELLYFCTDLTFRFPLLSKEQFLAYYDDMRAGQIAGEVSVWNLMSVDAPGRIYAECPQARIIALLRHPADMLFSLFQNHVFNKNEILTDFAEALDAEPHRRRGQMISPVLRCPLQALWYSEIGRYATQLRRYYNYFPRNQLLVIFFEDFISDTAAVYRSILTFLGVDPQYRPEFKIYNARKTVRSTLLRNLMVDAPKWLRQAARWALPHHTRARDWLEQWLWKLNTRKVAAQQVPAALRARLIEQYRQEIDDLAKLTGRDLSHWLIS